MDARRIVIEEDGAAGKQTAAPPVPPGWDLQDWLVILGIAFWEIAAGVIWWPAALLLAGAFCLGFSWMIERAKAKDGTAKR